MGRLLWTPPKERVLASHMYRFMEEVNRRFNKNFVEYHPLWEWSVENIPDFWATVWDFVQIQASSSYTQVVDDLKKMPGARWFLGAKLNFAKNLLRRRDEKTALLFKGEGQPLRKVSYKELYDSVSRISQALRSLGIKPGDRVVGFMPNMPETTMAMLAATSLGAIWSSCSPDFGIKGVMDRFGQIQPKVLFTADGYFFKGKRFDSMERIREISKQLPSLERLVVVSYTQTPEIRDIPVAVYFEDFIKPYSPQEIEFEELPFEHPLYIMYSSGTTGLPKCMVQTAGGILINHMKEHMLHV
ncbi:MAG: AMP-binding protein, partial [Desulfatiglandales bacterium]